MTGGRRCAAGGPLRCQLPAADDQVCRPRDRDIGKGDAWRHAHPEAVQAGGVWAQEDFCQLGEVLQEFAGRGQGGRHQLFCCHASKCNL